MPNLFLIPSDARSSLPTHAFIFSLHSPFLRSVFKSVDSNITLSLPFTASCLEKLLELLSKGLVSSDSRQQLEEVKEAVKALGFSMPHSSKVVAVTNNKNIGDSVMEDSFDVKTLKVELGAETMLSCNECGKRYKSLEGLQKHIKKKKHDIQSLKGDDLKAQFPCAACPRIFSRRTKLEIHTKKYHLETDEKGLVDAVTGEVGTQKCNFCPKNFSSSKHQQRHMSSVHTTKVISCDKCGKQFNRGDHMRRHKGSSLCVQN